MPNGPHRKRRWFQFSLRSTLFCTVLSGPLIGFMGPWVLDVQATIRAYVPILGPFSAGGEAGCIEPPTIDEIVRALIRVSDNDTRFANLKTSDTRIFSCCYSTNVDPPRVIALIGPAELHHAFYLCVIYIDSDTYRGIQVIRIDHNHFHVIGDVDPGVGG